jgi:hypothetical protein
MKKVTILGIVLVLLAVSVVPVMAKNPPNGNGNGASAGHGNSAGVNPGDRDQERQQKQDRQSNISTNGNHGRGRMRTPFYLQGTITTVDQETITVTLIHGNAQVKQNIGDELVLEVTDGTLGTLIFKLTQGGEDESGTGETAAPSVSSEDTDMNRVRITFAELAELADGQKVAIHGNVVDSVFTARLITVYIQAPVGEPPG